MRLVLCLATRHSPSRGALLHNGPSLTPPAKPLSVCHSKINNARAVQPNANHRTTGCKPLAGRVDRGAARARSAEMHSQGGGIASDIRRKCAITAAPAPRHAQGISTDDAPAEL